MNNLSVCHLCRVEKQAPVCRGACPCPVDGVDIVEHAQAADCPLGYHDGVPVPQAPRAETPAEWGPPKWAKLHEWASAFRGTPAERNAWLAAFRLELPCGECRNGWDAIVEANPPPDDPAMLWRWTWARHNDVRRKLGQAEVGEAEARAQYFRNDVIFPCSTRPM
jgi:Erv1 / Alr family